MASFQVGVVGWGGVGWDNNVPAAAFPARHTCYHTQHGIVSDAGGGLRWGGVGGTITSLQLRSSFDTLAATTNKASSSDAVGWGGGQ